jgi:hypothetical protein
VEGRSFSKPKDFSAEDILFVRECQEEANRMDNRHRCISSRALLLRNVSSEKTLSSSCKGMHNTGAQSPRGLTTNSIFRDIKLYHRAFVEAWNLHLQRRMSQVHATSSMMVSRLAYSYSTLKLEATYYSGTSFDFQRTTWRYTRIPDYRCKR